MSRTVAEEEKQVQGLEASLLSVAIVDGDLVLVRRAEASHDKSGAVVSSNWNFWASLTLDSDEKRWSD